MIESVMQSEFYRIVVTFCVSMLPVVELRGGLPYGIASGLNYFVALLAAILGNMFPVPFIIIFIRRIFTKVRTINHEYERIISNLERKAHLKGRLIQKYSVIGLLILVAVPFPGTGAWTGSLVAAMLDMRLKYAVPAIFLGLLISAAIITTITLGVIHIF